MAQTGFTPISIYYSSTATNVPTAGNLVAGELAINTADGKLFYKDSAGVVQTIASKATGAVAGTTTQVIYNNAGAYAGSANMTFSGTALTLANDASISGLTVGKGGGSDTASTTVGYLSLGAGATNTGTNNTSVGYGSMYVNTSGGSNVAFGGGALRYNTTGGLNSAIGFQALNSNTTASNNTAVGYQAKYSNTTGVQNISIGMQSGYTATAANNCVYVGYQSGYSASDTGDVQNTFVGHSSGYSNTTGYNNTFYGGTAGYYVTTGSKNTIIGRYTGNQGGLDIRTASNYIVLSDGDGNPRGIFNGSGDFFTSGTTATVGGNVAKINVLYDGGAYWGMAFKASSTTGTDINFVNASGTTVGSVSHTASLTLFNTTSDYRLKTVTGSVIDAGQRLDALEPIEYDWNAGGKTRGFLAHKFAEVYPNSVTGEKDAVDKNGNPVYQAMQASSSEVMADLIAEIQSLRKRVAILESK